MYLSSMDFIALLIAGSTSAFMLVILFIANYSLLKQNRYLKSRLRSWRKACARGHAELPF
jgi:hypothetical protein